MKQKCKLPIFMTVVSSLQTRSICYHNLYSWQKNSLKRDRDPEHTSALHLQQPILSQMWAQAPPALALGQQLLSAHLPSLRVKAGMGQSWGPLCHITSTVWKHKG